CIVRRPRTNTPLQALAALNDPAFFDAARGLALRVLREGGAETQGRIDYAFRLCTSRKPRADEVEILTAELKREMDHFQKNPKAAKAMFHGSLVKPSESDAVAAAAWTMVSNILINLDET